MTDLADNNLQSPSGDPASLGATAPIPPFAQAPGESIAETRPAASREWFWPIANAVGLAVVIAINYLANALEFNGQSTGDVVNKDPVPFQPAGWVFLIWSVIYVLLIAFAVYGLLPSGRRNARLQGVSPFFLVANVANGSWIFLWHWEQFLGSLVAILILLGSLLAIYAGLRIRNPIRRSIPVEPPTRVQRLVVWLPFSVYLGWICVAALANLMVWLDRSGWDGGPFSLNVWAVLFMLAGTLAAAAFAFFAADVAIPLVFVVAYAGIADRAWDDTTLVSVFAGIFALGCAALTALAVVIDHDRRRELPAFGPPAALGSDEPSPSQRSDGFQ